MTDPAGAGLTRAELLRRGAAGALILSGLGAATRAGAAGAPRAANGDAWLMAARDLQAHRFTPGSIDGLFVRWRLTVAGGVAATPAVRGGRAYAGSVGGEVVAAELADGRVIWRRRFAPGRYKDRRLGFFAAPTLVGNRLVVASDRVRCLDAGTGRTIWEAPPLRSGSDDDYFWGSPVVAGGLVLLGSGSGGETPTARGRVTAYRLSDGRRVWSTPMVPEGGNGGGVLAPVSVDLQRGSVWAATGSPYKAVAGPNPGTCSLVELALRDGAVRWRDQVFVRDTRGLDFNSAPMLLGSLAIAANKDGIFGWDRLERRRRWRTRLTPASATPGGPSDPTNGPEGGPIATDGQRVFALSNDGASRLFTVAALSPRTGRVLWKRTLAGLVFAAPVAVGRTLVMVTGFGRMYQFDGATGKGLNTGTLGEQSACAPAVADGLIVTGTGAAPFLPGESLVCVGRAPTA